MLGPEAPERLLTVSSGIHGVEGFAGSAVQHQLLSEQLDGFDLPPDTGLLLVHAINPYGFAHHRRVNESNVDLNRNFVRHGEPHPDNPGYEELYDAINPERMDEDSEAEARERFFRFAQTHGFPALQRVLSCGQYAHPCGAQFGGRRDEASNRALREITRRHAGGAREVVWVDVHTGLGPYGEVELITEEGRDHPAYARGRKWFGEVFRSTAAGESYSAPLEGVMERGLVEELEPGCAFTAFAAEFGTYDPTRVFWAMRADNWVHHHGDLESPQGRSVKAEILEVFRPSDPAWQARVLEGAARVLRQARDGLADAAAD